MIVFYELRDLREELCRCSVDPDRPGRLAAADPSTLVYENTCEAPRTVRWLDCSGDAPKPLDGVNLTHTVVEVGEAT